MALPPAFLSVPAPGDATLATLRRKVRLLATRTLLTTQAPGLADLQRVLVDALRERPGPVLDAVGSVDVLAPVLAVQAGVVGPEVLSDAVPALLAGLVARGALPEAVLFEGPVRVIADPARGRAFRCEARALAAHPGGLEVELEDRRKVPLDDLPPLRPYHPIDGALHLSLLDTNPLAMREEHPDKQGNAADLGGRPAESWVEALREALGLVRTALPTWHAELPVALQRMVPVGWEPERHLSASYREAPGLAYLTLHPDPVTLAEAIVHETQHGKLNLLSWLDPVLHNGRTFWTPSPVRPDLRPLMGVLLAVHAFVPVAALHHGLLQVDHPLSRTARFAERRAQVLAGNERGLAILRESAETSPLGRRVLDGLEGLHAALRAEADLRLDPEALPPG